MQRINRRRLLETTAAGTATALGASAACAGTADGLAEGSQRTVAGGFRATTTGGFLTIDADTAAGVSSILGQLDLSTLTVGTPIEISGRVYDDGTWASTRVSLPDITAELADIDFLGTAESLIEEFSLAKLLESIDLDKIVILISDVIDGLDLTQQEIDEIIDRVTGLLAGRDIGVGEQVVVNFLEDYLPNPEPSKAQNLLNLLGIDSIQDILALADIDNLDQLDVILQSYLEELDIERILANSTVERFLDAAIFDIGIPEFTGEIDRENGLVTATPSEITLVVGFQTRGGEFLNARLPFDISLTTGDSGTLSGSADGLATDSTTVTLVDNEFTLGIGELDLVGADLSTIISELITAFDIDVGNLDIESLLADLDIGGLLDGIGLGNIITSLVTDESGRHYLELDLAMDFAAEPLVPGALAGRVTDSDGSAVSGAVVSVRDPSGAPIETTVTVGDGTYEMAAPAGEYEITVKATGFRQFSGTALIWAEQQLSFDATLLEGPPPLPGFSREPQDPNGDGRYERVRGEDEFSILDVQALFNHLESDAVQNNPEFFRFQESGRTEVTILDVQALFNRLEG